MADQASGLLSGWLRRKRINVVLPYIKGKVLDFGCGTGSLAEFMSPDDYIGVDIDEDSLQIARAKYPNFRFEKEIPLNRQYDTIILLAVIEHMKPANLLLKQITNVLKQDGLIILTTPNPLFETIYWVGSKLKIFSPEAQEQHEKLVNYTGMQKLVLSAGMRIYYFKYFLWCANQLFILKHGGV